jgi:hypothetical protein
MSGLLSDNDIAELRGAWNSALSDTCVLQTRVEGTGGYGYGKPSYTNGATVACLFEPTKTLAGEVAGAQALNTDGDIILGRTTVLNNLMRLKITKLHGDTVAGLQVYEVVGGPVLNHVGWRVKVKRVTDGSET